MKKNNRPIGFLDSGIGGSTVLVKALKVLPTSRRYFWKSYFYIRVLRLEMTILRS